MAGDGWYDVLGTPSMESMSVDPGIEQHLTFLDVNEDGKLLLGASNFVNRTQTGSIWAFSKPDLSFSSEMSTSHHTCNTPVTAGAFLGAELLIAAEDTGMVVTYKLMQFDGKLGDDKIHFVPECYSNPHDSWVKTMSVCCEREEVVTGGADKRINVVEVSGLAVKKCYHPAHAQIVSSVSASPSDKCIFASASMDKTAVLWDTRLPKPASTLIEGSCGYTALAWKDSNHLVVGSEMGMVHVYDLKAKKSIEDIPLQQTPVRRLALSKSGLLASCADSTEIRSWNFESQKMIFPEFKHEHNFVSDVAWCPKTDVLYSCGLDGKVFAHFLADSVHSDL